MAEPDDLDRKMAFAVGCGLSVEQAAELAGLGRSTYYQRVNAHADFYSTWIAYGELIAAKSIAEQAGAAKAMQKAEEKLASRLDRALKITDMILAEVTSSDDRGRCESCKRVAPATIKELLAAHKTIVPFLARYAASEMPKRVQHSGAFLHGHVALQDDTVDSLTEFHSHMRALPGAIDVKGTHV